MARPRAFDETKVLEATMMVFWRHGYEATTTRMLEEVTGVGIRSLFNAFGDKETLFSRALDTYFETVRGNVDAAFAAPGRAALISFFEALQAEEPPNAISHTGCLMVNTVFELEKTNPKIRSQVEAYRAMWADVFERSLTADEIPDSAEKAEFLVGALWGALSQIKLAGSKSAAAPMATVVVQTLKKW